MRRLWEGKAVVTLSTSVHTRVRRQAREALHCGKLDVPRVKYPTMFDNLYLEIFYVVRHASNQLTCSALSSKASSLASGLALLRLPAAEITVFTARIP